MYLSEQKRQYKEWIKQLKHAIAFVNYIYVYELCNYGNIIYQVRLMCVCGTWTESYAFLCTCLVDISNISNNLLICIILLLEAKNTLETKELYCQHLWFIAKMWSLTWEVTRDKLLNGNRFSISPCQTLVWSDEWSAL